MSASPMLAAMLALAAEPPRAGGVPRYERVWGGGFRSAPTSKRKPDDVQRRRARSKAARATRKAQRRRSR